MQRNTILFLIESSWGDVEWMLPVLYEMRKLEPDWSLIGVFSPTFRSRVNQYSNQTAKQEFEELADKIVMLEDSDSTDRRSRECR